MKKRDTAGPQQASLFDGPPAPPPAPKVAKAPEEEPTPKARTLLSVGELTRDIKGTLETRYLKVWVRGEVSGFRGPNARGHLYFSLKDAEASIDTKIWASQAARMRFALREGLEVVAEGSVDVYEPQGRYSLIVSRLEPVGEGALALAFQQLKEKLAAEGLMGDRRSRPPRPLPYLPRRIGVVTSRTGAALQDFLRVLHMRNPRLSVLLCDARVQGEGAAAEVVRAIERLNQTDVDVIVLTRGGGSVEDLWTFNEERVARAIHASRVPVLSAIGHEVDFTIADFVADLRAPTPSAAAERLSPVLRDLLLNLTVHEGRLRKAVERRVMELRARVQAQAARLQDPRRMLSQRRLHLSETLERMLRVLHPALREQREALKGFHERLQRLRPEARLAEQRQRLNRLDESLRSALRQQLEAHKTQLLHAQRGLARFPPATRLAAARAELLALQNRLVSQQRQQLGQSQAHFHLLEGRLDAMSPLKVMSRGYAVAFRTQDGRMVRGVEDVKVGDTLGLKFARSKVNSLQGCEEIEATVTGLKSPTDC